jgi:thymidylate synthase (FAD)
MMPRVYLIAQTRFDAEAFCAFLVQADATWSRSPSATEAEELVEAAGRVCYMSFGPRQSPKTNEDYIRHLISMGHESVLEHVNWTFIIAGVSRAFTHQLVRHRVGFAFSQLSQQYHDESEAQFVEPLYLDQFPAAQAAWHRSVEAARETYRQIRDAVADEEVRLGLGGQKRESLRAIRSMARSVLPNATETKIVVTANARAVRHFLRVRGAIPGDAEMRLVAAELLKILSDEAPALFFDFRIEQLPDGSPLVVQRAMAGGGS